MKIAAAFVLGFVLWPVLEYSLHRILAHTVSFRNKFKTEHLKHHAQRDYFAAGADKLFAAVPSATALFLAAWAAAGAAAAAAFTIGFLACYMFYEWVHKRFHTHAPPHALGLRLRKHHFIHHFADPRSNHGVTTTLFDHVFGTFKTAEHVVIPRAFVPLWMFEPGGARIAEPYRADFRLSER